MKMNSIDRIFCHEDEEVIVPIIIRDVDDDILTIKIETEEESITFAQKNNSAENRLKDLYPVSGSWERGTMMEFKGSKKALNKVLSEMKFTGTRYCSKDDCKLNITVVDEK